MRNGVASASEAWVERESATQLLARLEWQLARPTESALAGEYRSVFRGRGMEFEQVVKYQWGDDLREIDWNVTARLGEPYRKQFVEERDGCVLLVFEDAPELQFGSTGMTRRAALLETAALLMLVALRQRDRVGVLYVSPEKTWLLPPKAGRDAVRHAALTLLETPPPSLDAEPAVESPWASALRAAPPRSVLVWLGPFGATTEPEEWSALTRRYQVVGFRADDAWDDALPSGGGSLSVLDPVAGCITELDLASAESHAAHVAWIEAREMHFAALFPDERARHAVRTDASVFRSVVEFFHRHAQFGVARR